MTNNSNLSSDEKLKTELGTKYAIDIGVRGEDNATGLGFVTFLPEEELAEKLPRNGFSNFRSFFRNN